MTGLGDKTVGCIRLYRGDVAGDDDGLPLVVDVNVYKGLMEVGLVARARGHRGKRLREVATCRLHG